MAPLPGTTHGGPPLCSYIIPFGSDADGATCGLNSGGLTLLQFHPTYSIRPPHVGFPAWGARGGLPLFHMSLLSKKGHQDWGAAPYFNNGTESYSLQPAWVEGRGASPYFSKAVQPTGPGGLPLYQYVTPRIGSVAPHGHRDSDGGPPLVSQQFLGSQTSRLQAGAITPAQ